MGHNISELQNFHVNVISSFSMGFCLKYVTSFTTYLLNSRKDVLKLLLVTLILQKGQNISQLQNFLVNVVSSFSMGFCLKDVMPFTT